MVWCEGGAGCVVEVVVGKYGVDFVRGCRWSRLCCLL